MVPDLSVLWVIFFVLLLTALVNHLLFKPITRVMQERQEAIQSAQSLADESVERARAGAEEFERQTSAARAKVYAEMEAKRRRALDQRASLLVEARQEAEQAAGGAINDLERAVQEARLRLEADATALGDAIFGRVLDRPSTR